MQPARTFSEQMHAARRLEQEGRFSDAVAIYQKLFHTDPNEEEVIGRLLIIYRKLKDYRKELSVLNEAIAAFQRRQKTIQQKWIKAHPQAAKAGRSILRELEKGGDENGVPGADPVIERWIKRKVLVTDRMSGKKRKRPKTSRIPQKKRQDREEAAVSAKKAAKERKEELAQQKNEERERRAAQALRKKEERAQRKADAARQKDDLEKKKAERERHPSLFIVILSYLVPIGQIDAVMEQHISYLRKHFANRDFLISGRTVPRTGGIILARAKNRNAIEKTVQKDPFVKRKLASAEIIEFSASQISKELASAVLTSSFK